MYISRVTIKNYRNFKLLDVALAGKAVLVGENAVGKSNFIRALQLIFDPNLSDSARELNEDDFWDGLDSPMENGEEIEIRVELKDFSLTPSLMALLSDYLVGPIADKTAAITYKYKVKSVVAGENVYEFVVFGGDDEGKRFAYNQRKYIPIKVLPALRDAEQDLKYWNKSPLKPLVERLSIAKAELDKVVGGINDSKKKLLEIGVINDLEESISTRLSEMVGSSYSIEPSLDIIPSDVRKILKSLRLYTSGATKRPLGEESLGVCNVLYLALLILDIEYRVENDDLAGVIIAIEEPEAHLHPQLQRMIYRDVLNQNIPLILTTHSPNIVSVTPIDYIVKLMQGPSNGTQATSAASSSLTGEEKQDIQRYIDTNRGEIAFSKGIILIEGAAEEYLINKFAFYSDSSDEKFLDEFGVSVCNINGTHFESYVKFIGSGCLNIPYVILTDGDCKVVNNTKRYFGYERCIRLINEIHGVDVNAYNALLDAEDIEELKSEFSKYNIFLGEYTLEIELVVTGVESMLLAFNSLVDSDVTQRRFERYCNEESDGEYPSLVGRQYILNRIGEIGKGRFAQRLASQITSDVCPEFYDRAFAKIFSKVV